MEDAAIFFGGLAAIIVAIVVVCAGGAYMINYSQCSTIHELTGAPTNVTISAGCLVKMDGKWMTGDAALNYKEIKIK